LILRAPDGGTVVTDNFRIGQHVAAGTLLLQIADEETVWVEVQIPESQLAAVQAGQAASVTPKGSEQRHTGKVVNIHHRLDQRTRTAGVRLEIDNSEDELHPGMFVNAEIEAGQGKMALLLPEQAIQRQGSELIVFVEEEPGHFERREVRVGKPTMGLVPVLEGVKEGESVVIRGAFVLASELAKSGFEAHQH
jgi:RND family efflux transporter MFP subunit